MYRHAAYKKLNTHWAKVVGPKRQNLLNYNQTKTRHCSGVGSENPGENFD
jgi:hypothetical protein